MSIETMEVTEPVVTPEVTGDTTSTQESAGGSAEDILSRIFSPKEDAGAGDSVSVGDDEDSGESSQVTSMEAKADVGDEKEESADQDDDALPDDKTLLQKGDDGRQTVDKRQMRKLLSIKNTVKALSGAETYAEVSEFLGTLKAVQPLLDEGLTDPARVKEVVDSANAYKEFVTDFTTSDPTAMRGLVSELNRMSPDSMKNFASAFIPALLEENREAADIVVRPAIEFAQRGAIEGQYARAREVYAEAAKYPEDSEMRNTLLQQAAAWSSAGMHLEFMLTGKHRDKDAIFKEQPTQRREEPRKEPSEAERELSRLNGERQQQYASLVESKTSEVAARVIDGYLKQFEGKIPSAVLKVYRREAQTEVASDLNRKSPNELRILQQKIAQLGKMRSGADQEVTTIVETYGRLVNEALKRVRPKLSKELSEMAVTASKEKIERAKAISEQKAPTASTSKSGGLPQSTDWKAVKAKSPEELAAALFAARRQ